LHDALIGIEGSLSELRELYEPRVGDSGAYRSYEELTSAEPE
jgi:hypothetical protein